MQRNRSDRERLMMLNIAGIMAAQAFSTPVREPSSKVQKPRDTSATGNISKAEREARNKERKRRTASKKRNRK